MFVVGCELSTDTADLAAFSPPDTAAAAATAEAVAPVGILGTGLQQIITYYLSFL